MLTIVLSILAALLCVLTMFLEGRRRQKRILNRDRAAGMLIHEHMLSDAIYGRETGGDRSMGILFISWKQSGRQEYAFPGDAGVMIGRDPGKNQIAVWHPHVSSKHACVYTRHGKIFLADMGSVNGTYVGKGFSRIRVTSPVELRDGEAFYIGGICFHVCAKVYDAAFV